MFWIAIFLYTILLAAVLWIWFIIIKLLTDKEYAKNPPIIPSLSRERKVMFAKVSEILENADRPMKILDPGCGFGTLIIDLAKTFPQHQFVGIEWSPVLAKMCRFRTRNINNITIIQKDMFACSFSEYDIIVCFLMQPLMERFGKKLKDDAKTGLIVFSNSFYIPNIELSEKVETRKHSLIKDVFIYRL